MTKPNDVKKIFVPMRHPVGGIRTYLKYTYKHLERHSYEVTLIAPYKEYLYQLKIDLKDLDVKLIHTRKEASVLSLFMAVFKSLYKYKYDVIHSQGFTAGIIIVLANLFFRVPHLMTSHDILRDDLFRGRIAFLKKKMLEVLFRRIDLIQSVSYDAQNNLLDYLPGLRRNITKKIVIKNGIDIDQFAPATVQENAKLIHQYGDEFVIGFIGRFMPQKGFVYLMEVVEILLRTLGEGRKIRVICVGGYGGFIREYKKNLVNREINNYFHFIGFQPNINSILKKFHVLVMPSLWEACPILPMEALVCGAPIVAFSCIGLREVLKDTPAIMVQVKDSEGMAKEIIRIMENYEYVKNNFDNFAIKAKERFDVTITVNKLRDLFADLTSKRQATSMYFKR